MYIYIYTYVCIYNSPSLVTLHINPLDRRSHLHSVAVYLFVRVFVCLYLHECVSVCLFIGLHMQLCSCVCMCCLCVCVCVCVCVTPCEHLSTL